MSTRRVTKSPPAARGAVLERVLRAVATVDSDRRRSVGPGDRRPRDAQGGPSVVIAAFARAKLLGIKLLTLDARIVLAPADAGSDVTAVAAQARSLTPLVDRPVSRLAVGHRTDLAYAVRLLEEGSQSLNEARAMRSLDLASPE
jgi:hypothetical protein